MALDIVSRSRSFGGAQLICRHASVETGTAMRFAAFVPPQAEQGPVPVVWFLSGLTCTEENFTVKAGAQRAAADLGLMLIAPDTSPRGEDVPDDPDGAYDFGLGAGFYVDATAAPWSRNYRMRSYVETELPAVVAAELPAESRSARHHRPFDGRPRGPYDRAEEPGSVCRRIRLRPDLLTDEVPLGRKGPLGLFGAGSLAVARL